MKTTPEMNAQIVGILRTRAEHWLYAALRIEELEAEAGLLQNERATLPGIVAELHVLTAHRSCHYDEPGVPVGCGNWDTCLEECPIRRLREMAGVRPQKDGTLGYMQAQAKMDQLWVPLYKLAAYMLTCKRKNTDEWMEELAERVQQAATILGERVAIRYAASCTEGVLIQTAAEARASGSTQREA